MMDNKLKIRVKFITGDETTYPEVHHYDICDRSLTIRYEHERHRIRIPLRNVLAITFIDKEYDEDEHENMWWEDMSRERLEEQAEWLSKDVEILLDFIEKNDLTDEFNEYAEEVEDEQK